jgi:hypothetical protein
VEQLLVLNEMVECNDETPTFLFSVYHTFRHGIPEEWTDWLNAESGNSDVGQDRDKGAAQTWQPESEDKGIV